jgi:hypothetical protein
VTEVVDRHHVRVIELCQSACFASEALGERGVVAQGRVEHLDGNRPVELLVARFIDRTHTALADQLELLELGEPKGELFDRHRLRTPRTGREIGPFIDVESGAQSAGRADALRRVRRDGPSTVGTDT